MTTLVFALIVANLATTFLIISQINRIENMIDDIRQDRRK